MSVKGHQPSKQLTPRENKEIKKLHDLTMPTLKETVSTVPTTDTLKEGWSILFNDGTNRRRYFNIDGTIDYTEMAGTSTTGDSGCHITMDGSQTVASGVEEILEFDSSQWDLLSEFNTSTYRFTATAAGKYLVCLNVTYSTNSAGDRIRAIIHKNGAQVRMNQINAGGTNNNAINIVSVINMAATDYLEFYCANMTNDDTVSGSNDYTFVDIVKVL